MAATENDDVVATTFTTTTSVTFVVRSRDGSRNDLTTTGSEIDVVIAASPLENVLEQRRPSPPLLTTTETATDVERDTAMATLHDTDQNPAAVINNENEQPAVVIGNNDRQGVIAALDNDPAATTLNNTSSNVTIGDSSGEEQIIMSKKQKAANVSSSIIAETTSSSVDSSNGNHNKNVCKQRQLQSSSKPRWSSIAAVSRSLLNRIRNRLKPIAPCQALHLVPPPPQPPSVKAQQLSSSSPKQQEERAQMVRNKQQSSTEQRCCESSSSVPAPPPTMESPAGSPLDSNKTAAVQVTTTVVEIATHPHQCYHQSELPSSTSFSTTTARIPQSSSSGFFSSSSNKMPSTFSPTTDNLIASTSFGVDSAIVAATQEPQKEYSPGIPTSRSCPFPHPTSVRPPSKKDNKKQPPLVKFNQLGDISPTIKKQQLLALQQDKTTPPQEKEKTSSGRLFLRSLIRGSKKRLFNRSSSTSSKVPQSTTMPSLRCASPSSRGYESDEEQRQHVPRRSASLSSLILGFLRGRSRVAKSSSRTSSSPRVASPVGPRLSPERRRSRAGYHCDVPSCHCHKFPEAFSVPVNGVRSSTIPYRPHLQKRDQRPSSYHAPCRALMDDTFGNKAPLTFQKNEPTFLRGYGPNAPDDPAPQFHRHAALIEASLSPLDSDGFYDDDEIVGERPSPLGDQDSDSLMRKCGPQVLTSTPYQKASPFQEPKFLTADFRHNLKTNGYSHGFASLKTAPTCHNHYQKPPPIVSFIQDESEEDLLYRDGDLIQSVNGGYHSQQVPIIVGESFEIGDQISAVHMQRKGELSKQTLLFPSCPESSPKPRMPVVFLPAYPARLYNKQNGVINSDSRSNSNSSGGSSQQKNCNIKAKHAAKSNGTAPIVCRQQPMTPLRT